MKSYKNLALLILLLAPGLLWAGPQQGVLKEFRMAEEALHSRKRTEADRRKTLEDNLVRGMRQTIVRVFYEDRKELIKDLNGQTILYENPTSPLVYYVKYKKFLCRFDFERDPEMFIQAPVLKKVLILDDALMTHMNDAAQPAPSAPAGGGAPKTP